MSANRSLPTTPLEPIPAGADVRDIRPWLNRMRDLVAQLVAETRHLNQRTRVPVVPPHNPTQPPIPLQVYLSGGYICVRAGHHIFWNSYSERIETVTYDGDEDEWVAGAGPTLLEKEAADAWIEPANASVIYVKRVFNSDGTANTTLEYAMPGLATPEDDYAAVINDVTNTEARWILATIADGVVTQWWTGGDIYELRVA